MNQPFLTIHHHSEILDREEVYGIECVGARLHLGTFLTTPTGFRAFCTRSGAHLPSHYVGFIYHRDMAHALDEQQLREAFDRHEREFPPSWDADIGGER